MQLTSFSELLLPVESAGASTTASTTASNAQAFADILQSVPGTAESLAETAEGDEATTAIASPATSGEIMPALATNRRLSDAVIAALHGTALATASENAVTSVLETTVADVELTQTPALLNTQQVSKSGRDSATDDALTNIESNTAELLSNTASAKDSHEVTDVMPQTKKAAAAPLDAQPQVSNLELTLPTNIEVQSSEPPAKGDNSTPNQLSTAASNLSSLPEKAATQPKDASLNSNDPAPVPTLSLKSRDLLPLQLNKETRLNDKLVKALSSSGSHIKGDNSITNQLSAAASNLSSLPEKAAAQPKDANLNSNDPATAPILSLKSSTLLPLQFSKETMLNNNAVTTLSSEELTSTPIQASAADKTSQLFTRMTGKAIGPGVKPGQKSQADTTPETDTTVTDLFQLLNKREITVATTVDKVASGTRNESQYEQATATATPTFEQDLGGTNELLPASNLPTEEFSTLLHASVAMGAYAWAEETSNHVQWLMDQDLDSATLQLHPQELGRIDINIEVKEGQTYVHFQAANPEARELLQSSLPSLRDLLAQGGLMLAEGHVDQQLNRNTNHTNEQGSSPGNVTRKSADELPAPHQQVQRHSLHQVDYYA
jgi:flagellar hook-length control protein FliK